jgi:hypothetical protein
MNLFAILAAGIGLSMIVSGLFAMMGKIFLEHKHTRLKGLLLFVAGIPVYIIGVSTALNS